MLMLISLECLLTCCHNRLLVLIPNTKKLKSLDKNFLHESQQTESRADDSDYVTDDYMVK